MGVETCFEVSEDDRTSFVSKNIIGKLPSEVREQARKRASAIVNQYVGQDINALSVLAYAAERGRFDEFAEKLERHYKESLQFVHPEARKLRAVPGAVRAEMFFEECYQAMGIQPTSG